MPPLQDTPAKTGFAIDEAAHTIRFTRHLEAAPDEVFAAWTEPEQVASWWDPTGEPLMRCDIDLRVGGGFSFVNRSHPEMPFSGTYTEIAPPTRLVFEAMGAKGRVLLDEAEGGTAMTVEIVCASAEQLQHFVAMGVAAGTSQTLDNLVAHVERG